jgi:hypothetical protein
MTVGAIINGVGIVLSVEAEMKKSYVKPTLTKHAVLSMVVAGGTPPGNGGEA